MKNLLALIGLAVVLVGGLGWYLGWYKIGAEPAGSGHTKINVDVDTTKISNDVKKGEKKIEDFINKDHTTVSPSGIRQVEGTPTGLQFGVDGSVTLPKLPALPAPPDQINADVKIVVPPPPSFVPGQ